MATAQLAFVPECPPALSLIELAEGYGVMRATIWHISFLFGEFCN